MTQRRIYQNECPYFITFNTAKGEPVFEDAELAQALAQTMRNAARLKGWTILAYQIMPNHVHLLVQQQYHSEIDGDRAAAESRARRTKLTPVFPAQVSVPAMGKPRKRPTISDFMYTVKSYFLEILRKKYDIRNSIWQPRFNSRIVNTEKYLTTVIEYIQYNPTKDGLPARYTKSPYRFINMRKIKEAF
jgi:REP element-mobilizing transposase RayT